MTFDELGLHDDVRQFVRELDMRKRDEPEREREKVKIETRTLVGKEAEQYDQSLIRQFTRVNPSSNNTSPNVP